jgi:hypothetical protein
MVCQKDLFNHLLCIFSIKESFVSLSENIDIIELCYLLGTKKQISFSLLEYYLGNIVALASMDLSQIEGMKQPFIDSLFNILDACRRRQTMDEQSEKQTKMTSIWHPILGHIRGKTIGNTVFVYFHILFVSKFVFYFRSNQEIVQRVIVQYKFLWSKSFVNMLFESIPTGNPSSSSSVPKKETSKANFDFI